MSEAGSDSHMKYNILTVINEGYAPFGRLFINSLFENIDLKNVQCIQIYDTGLAETTREYMNYFPKVEIISTGANFTSSGIHDEGWKENTYSKTKYLLQSLEKSGTPTLMVDSDCIFVSCFEDVIDFDADVLACSRARPGFSRHIGSFFGALNVESSKSFLNKWIENVDFLQENTDLKHCESPALSKTIDENKEYKVQEVPEQVVSAVFPDAESLIYHLKSDHYATTIDQRLQLPHAKPFTERYL